MAGRIPTEFIDELLQRVDIVEVVESRLALRRAGHEYTARCPFHDEKTPSFTVSPAKQFYHCFGCGAHGSAIGFLMAYEGLEFVDAVEVLAQTAGLEAPREAGGGRRADHADLYKALEDAARFYQHQLKHHPAAKPAVDYLKGRGLSGTTAAAYGLGFAPPGWDELLRATGNDNAARDRLVRAGLAVDKGGGRCYDRLRNRVVFPIRDRRGRVVGFGGRVLDDTTPKYLNSSDTPIFHKGRELYGLYEALRHGGRPERLLVVEGYMDVVSLAEHGVGHAVATLGTATTPEHIRRLFRTAPEVVFCFDGDAAGRRAAWRALENALPAMSGGCQVRFMFLPQGEDPDSLVRQEGGEAFSARLDEALLLSQFLMEELARQADTTTVDGRARFVELARPLVSKVPQGPYRQLLTDELAQTVRMDVARVSSILIGNPARQAPRRRRDAPQEARGGRVRRTAVRLAISHLLHQPALAQDAGDPAPLRALRRPGMGLLVDIIESLQVYPHLTTGGLLERWRDTEAGRHLDRLAQEPPPEPGLDIEAEFRDALAHLHQQLREQRVEDLLQKQQQTGLDATELDELRRLWGQRDRNAPGLGH